MKVAVIGGSGFIGKYLVKQLVKRDYEVRVLDLRNDDPPKEVEFYLVDVTSREQMFEALQSVEAVYHLAGTVLNSARKNPYLTIGLDALGTANVLEACVKNDVQKILFASSFYAYDGLPEDADVDENQRSDIFKAEMFGVAKLVGERLVIEYAHRHGLKYVILRLGPAYGPCARCSCVVYDFLKAGLSGQPLIIWGRGERKNQYTYVEDIAEGCAGSLSFENEIFNLVSPVQVSMRDLASLLVADYGFKIEYDYDKPEGSSMPYMSPKKAIEKIGWKPTGLGDGIRRTVLELRSSLLLQGANVCGK